jgi:Tfp pilus assembly protein PilE
MKTTPTNGFAHLELIIMAAITTVLVVSGYLLYNRDTAKTDLAQSRSASEAEMAASALLKAVPAAPAVKDTSDLDQLLQSINELDLEANTIQADQLDQDLQL